MLAFDIKEPWTCHQSYKILDELHAEIFARPEVTAHRIVAVADLHRVVVECMTDVENKVLAAYRLTQYFLLYLLREALELDEIGRAFCAKPESLIVNSADRIRLRECATRIVKDIIIDLNAELSERATAGTPFDYKRELKSPNPVRELRRNIFHSIKRRSHEVVRARSEMNGQTPQRRRLKTVDDGGRMAQTRLRASGLQSHKRPSRMNLVHKTS